MTIRAAAVPWTRTVAADVSGCGRAGVGTDWRDEPSAGALKFTCALHAAMRRRLAGAYGPDRRKAISDVFDS